MASQRELAIAGWGPAEVGKQWDESHWMRALVLYRIDAARGVELRTGG